MKVKNLLHMAVLWVYFLVLLLHFRTTLRLFSLIVYTILLKAWLFGK